MTNHLPLSTSSQECLAALRRLGFRVENASESIVTVVSPTGRHVFVHPNRSFDKNELAVLLRFAEVDPTSFLHACGRLASGEFAFREPPSEVRATLAGFDLRLVHQKRRR